MQNHFRANLNELKVELKSKFHLGNLLVFNEKKESEKKSYVKLKPRLHKSSSLQIVSIYFPCPTSGVIYRSKSFTLKKKAAAQKMADISISFSGGENEQKMC